MTEFSCLENPLQLRYAGFMSTDMSSEPAFIWVCCQPGVESALKSEIQELEPGLRFAFSRPGFVTFKADPSLRIRPDFVLDSVFARQYGVSIRGKISSQEELLQEITSYLEKNPAMRNLVLHVWTRPSFPPGEEPRDYRPWDAADQLYPTLSQNLAARFPQNFSKNLIPDLKQGVLDVILIDENSFWLGIHVHHSSHLPFPGGDPRINLPSEAPSRAYLKLEEAIAVTGANLEKGQTALELGSAPGGAVYSLLHRGLKVIGVDPAEMNPRILEHPHYVPIRKPAEYLVPADLPEKIDWLLLDVNLHPKLVLPTVITLLRAYRESLKGAFLTFKMTQMRLRNQIPRIQRELEEAGYETRLLKQLPAHKQEFLIYLAPH